MTAAALFNRTAGRLLRGWRPRRAGAHGAVAATTPGVAAVSAETVDLGEARHLADPWAAYEALRGHGAVQFLPRHGFWIVLGHAELREAAARPNAFSNRPYDYVDHVLIGADPPAHTAVRGIVARHFSAAVLNRLESEAKALPALLRKPEFDLVADYAVPFSRIVAGRLLGAEAGVLETIAAAEQAAQATAQPLLRLISAIDTVADRFAIYRALHEAGGASLGPDDLKSLVRFLWLAAITTTQRAIACAAITLLRDPVLLAGLRAQPTSMGRFVEEILRLYPPELMLPRVATQPTELGGVQIPAGAAVMLCLAAANRDPAVFADPGALRLDRAANPHLSFGSGIHHCSGTGLARRILPIAIKGLIDAPDLRVVQSLETAVWHRTITAITLGSLAIGT